MGILNFFKNVFSNIPQKLNTFGNTVKGIISKGGNIINTFGGLGRKIYNGVSTIPFLGNIVKKSPIGAGIEGILDLSDKAGNLLSSLGGGDYKGAVNSGAQIAKVVGVPAEKADRYGRFVSDGIDKVQQAASSPGFQGVMETMREAPGVIASRFKQPGF